MVQQWRITWNVTTFGTDHKCVKGAIRENEKTIGEVLEEFECKPVTLGRVTIVLSSTFMTSVLLGHDANEQYIRSIVLLQLQLLYSAIRHVKPSVGHTAKLTVAAASLYCKSDWTGYIPRTEADTATVLQF